MADFEVDRRLLSGARRILAAKVALIASLPPGYVHDPALVILLTLFLHERPMPHRAVCDAVDHVPFSVSNRWMKAIEGDGLIIARDVSRGGDPIVMLTALGLSTVKRAIVAIGEAEQRVTANDETSPAVKNNSNGVASRNA